MVIKSFEKYVFLVGTALVPTLVFPFLSNSFQLPKVFLFRGGVLLLLTLFGFRVLFARNFSLPKMHWSFWGAIGVLIGSIALSTVFSVSPHISFWGSYGAFSGLLQTIYYVVFFLLFVSFFDKKSVNKIVPWICYGALAVALISVLQNVWPSSLAYWDTDVLRGRTYIGTLGNPNFLASYLLVTLPFFGLIWRGSVNRKMRWFWVVGALLVLFVMLSTLSRAAMVGLLFSISFFAIFYSRKLLIIPVLALIVVIFVNLVGDFGNDFLHRFILRSEAGRSVSSRIVIWDTTFDVIKDRPLIGYGPEVFSESFAKHLPLDLYKLEYFGALPNRAHNVVLEVCATYGFAGLLAHILFWGYVVFIGLWRRKVPIVFASMTSMGALFVANMFGFSTITTSFYLWMFAGIIVVSGGGRRVVNAFESVSLISRKIIFGILTAVLLSVFIFTNLNMVVADHYYDEARTSYLSLDDIEVSSLFRKAVVANPNETFYSSNACDFSTISAKKAGPNVFDLVMLRVNWFCSRAIETAGEGVIESLYLAGKVKVLEGDYDTAISLFEEANLKAPMDEDVLIEWSRALKLNGQYPESLDVYEKYLQIAPYWDIAFDYDSLSDEKKEEFRLFFKHNPMFIAYLRETVEVAGKAGNAKEEYYQRFVDEIKSIYSRGGYAILNS